MWKTDYESILQQIDSLDPALYGKDRNFVDGSVSRLSPYISRGVISTKFVLDHLIRKGFNFHSVHKFIQELAWRDYWQQVWKVKGNAIDNDLKRKQKPINHFQMPSDLLSAKTGIEAIDNDIKELYVTGYMHNHMRMYVAAIACNMANAHWKTPAQWMYYHLLDADWASNALSWQWVAGANANKKYVANQENINKYWKTNQKDTFLDIPYASFENWEVPKELKKKEELILKTILPEFEELNLDPALPTLLYTFYNLDPKWRAEEPVNRVLILEPSFFEKYPVSEHTISYILNLSKNIKDLQICTKDFSQIQMLSRKYIFKEHPTNTHFVGEEDPRDWMFSVEGYFPSFFAYWKKCKKELDLWI